MTGIPSEKRGMPSLFYGNSQTSQASTSSTTKQNTNTVALHCLKRLSSDPANDNPTPIKMIKIDVNKEWFLCLVMKSMLITLQAIKTANSPSQYITNATEQLIKYQANKKLYRCKVYSYCEKLFFDCDVVSSEMLELLLLLFNIPRIAQPESVPKEYNDTLKEIIESLVQLNFDKIFLSLMNHGVSLDELNINSLKLLLLAHDNKQYKIAAAILNNNKSRAKELLRELVNNFDLLTNIIPFLDEPFINLIFEFLVNKSFISLEANSNGIYCINSRCGKGRKFTDKAPPTPLEQALSVENNSLLNLIFALGSSYASSIKGFSIVHYCLFSNDYKSIIRAFKYIHFKDLSINGFNLIQSLITHESWIAIFALHIFGYNIDLENTLQSSQDLIPKNFDDEDDIDNEELLKILQNLINKGLSYKIIQDIINQKNNSKTKIAQALLLLQDIFNNKNNYSGSFNVVNACSLNEEEFPFEAFNFMSENAEKFTCLESLISKLIEQCKIVEFKKLSNWLFNKTQKSLKISKPCLMKFLNNTEVSLSDKSLFLETLIDLHKINNASIIINSNELFESISDNDDCLNEFEEVLFTFLLFQTEFDLAKHISQKISEERSKACFLFFLELTEYSENFTDRYSHFIGNTYSKTITDDTTIDTESTVEPLQQNKAKNLTKVDLNKHPQESISANIKQLPTKSVKIIINKEKFLRLVSRTLLMKLQALKIEKNHSQLIPNELKVFIRNQDYKEIFSYCEKLFLNCDDLIPEMMELLLFLFKPPKVTRQVKISYEYYSSLKDILEYLITLNFDKIFLSLMDCGISLDEIKVNPLSLILLAYYNKQYKVAAAILGNNQHRAGELLNELVYNCDILTAILPYLDRSFINLIFESLVNKSFISLETDSEGIYHVDSRCGKGDDLTENAPATPLEQALIVDNSSLYTLLLALGASKTSSIKGFSCIHYCLFLNNYNAILGAFQHLSFKDLYIDDYDLIESLISHNAWISIFTLHIFGYKIEDAILEQCFSLMNTEDCLDMLLKLSDNNELLKRVCKQDVVNLIKRDEFKEDTLTDKVFTLLAIYDDSIDTDLVVIIDNHELIELPESSINNESLLKTLQHVINQGLSDPDEYYPNQKPLASLSIKEILDNINQHVNNFDAEACLELYANCLKDDNVITDETNKLFELALDYLIIPSDKEIIEKLETLIKEAFNSCKLTEILIKIYKTKANVSFRIHIGEFLNIINNIYIQYYVKIAFITSVLTLEGIEYYSENPLNYLEQSEDGFNSLILDLVKHKNLDFLKIFLQNLNRIINIDSSLISAFMFTLNIKDFTTILFILEHLHPSIDLLSYFDSFSDQNSILRSIVVNCNNNNICTKNIILDLLRRGSIELECNDAGEYHINSRCGTSTELNPNCFTPLEQALLIGDSGLFLLLTSLQSSYNSSVIGCNLLHFALLLNNKYIILNTLKNTPHLINDLNNEDIIEKLLDSECWLSIIAFHILGGTVEETNLEIACCLVDEEELLDFLFKLSNSKELLTDDLKTKVLYALEHLKCKKESTNSYLKLIRSLYQNVEFSVSTYVDDEASLVDLDVLDIKLKEVPNSEFKSYCDETEVEMEKYDLTLIQINIAKVIQDILEKEDDSKADLLQILFKLKDIFNNQSGYYEVFKFVEICLLNNRDLSLTIINSIRDMLDFIISNKIKNEHKFLESLIFKLVKQGKIVEIKILSKLLFKHTKKPITLSKSRLIELLENKDLTLKDKKLFLEALVDFINTNQTVFILEISELLNSISDTDNYPSILEEALFVFLLLQKHFSLACNVSKTFSEEKFKSCFRFYIKSSKPSTDVLNQALMLFCDTSFAFMILHEIFKLQSEQYKNDLSKDSNFIKASLNTNNIDLVFLCMRCFPLQIQDFLNDEINSFIDVCFKEKKWNAIFIMYILEINISEKNYKESIVNLGVKEILDILFKISKEQHLLTRQIKSFICSFLLKEKSFKQNIDDLIPEARYLLNLFYDKNECTIDDQYGKRIIESISQLNKIKIKDLFIKAVKDSNFDPIFEILDKMDSHEKVLLFNNLVCLEKQEIISFLNKIFIFSNKQFDSHLILTTLQAVGFVQNIEELKNEKANFFVSNYFVTNLAYEFMDNDESLFELLVQLQNNKQSKDLCFSLIETKDFVRALNLLMHINTDNQQSILKIIHDSNEQTLIELFLLSHKIQDNSLVKTVLIKYMSSCGWIKIEEEGQIYEGVEGDIFFNDNVVLLSSTEVFKKHKQSLIAIMSSLKINPLEIFKKEEFLNLIKIKDFRKASLIFKDYIMRDKTKILKLLSDCDFVNFLMFECTMKQNEFSKDFIVDCMFDRGLIKKQEECTIINFDDVYCEGNIVLLSTTEVFKSKKQSLLGILSHIHITPMESFKKDMIIHLIQTKELTQALNIFENCTMKEKENLLEICHNSKEENCAQFLTLALKRKTPSPTRRIIIKK